VNWLLGDCAFQKLHGTAAREKKGVRPS
jgi:hypothetical protein